MGTRYLEVQAEEWKRGHGKKKNKTNKRSEKKEGDCKWCEMGECWSHGQIEKPDKNDGATQKKAKIAGAGKVKKGQLKQSGGTNAKGLGKGRMAMMQAMMAMMSGKGMGKG